MDSVQYTPKPLYNTIVWVQAHFHVSYPNRVISRIKCNDYIEKWVLNDHLGSNPDLSYINCVITNRVIKRFRCIRMDGSTSHMQVNHNWFFSCFRWKWQWKNGSVKDHHEIYCCSYQHWWSQRNWQVRVSQHPWSQWNCQVRVSQHHRWSKINQLTDKGEPTSVAKKKLTGKVLLQLPTSVVAKKLTGKGEPTSVVTKKLTGKVLLQLPTSVISKKLTGKGEPTSVAVKKLTNKQGWQKSGEILVFPRWCEILGIPRNYLYWDLLGNSLTWRNISMYTFIF